MTLVPSARHVSLWNGRYFSEISGIPRLFSSSHVRCNSLRVLNRTTCNKWSGTHLAIAWRLASTVSHSCGSKNNFNTSSLDHGATAENFDEIDVHDPVYPYLKGRGRSIPLKDLAKTLPDDVIEKLEGGLKCHLQKFPKRYEVRACVNGILCVNLTPGHFTCNKIQRKRIWRETASKDILYFLPANRFIEINTVIKSVKEQCKKSDEASNEATPTNYAEVREFIHNHFLSRGFLEFWMLVDENVPSTLNECATLMQQEKLTQVEGEPTDDGNPVQRLKSFCWEHLKDASMLDNALLQYQEDPKNVRLYMRRYMPHIKSEDAECDDTNSDLECVEDYNVYRVCRAMSTQHFMPLEELHRIAGDWVTQPLAVVLAIAATESCAAGRPLLELKYDPNNAARVVAVRFCLEEELYLPDIYRTMTITEMEEELKTLFSERKSSRKAMPNVKRVKRMNRERLLQRCLALHELGTTPMCHPDVLAYYVFDILPQDGQLVMTGSIPQLLPEDVRRRTDARQRTWLRRYPHLFRFVERPPEMFVLRVDVLKKQGLGDSLSNTVTPFDDKNITMLLQNPNEQLRFVLSVVLARLEVSRGKPLLPSHLPKFFNKDQRKLLFKSAGGVLGYLQNHPDVFKLTNGIHEWEPVITVVEEIPSFLTAWTDVKEKGEKGRSHREEGNVANNTGGSTSKMD